MRHHNSGRKFGRNTSHRRAMFRNLAANLILHERIETTEAKAKELRRIVERLITKATRLGDHLTADLGKMKDDARAQALGARMHAQRFAAEYLPKLVTRTLKNGDVEDVDLVHKLFHEIAPRFMERVKANKGGGYTRIILNHARRGDGAKTAFIELLGGATKAEPAAEKKPAEDKGSEKKKADVEAAAAEPAPVAEEAKPKKRTRKKKEAETAE